MHFALTEEQAAIQETALTFAKERIAPHAAEWDEKSHFPVDVIRETAALGMATIYVPAEQGGSGLSRLDGALIMEALAYGCPAISGYISIHNMVAWMVAQVRLATRRSRRWMPKLASMEWLSSYCLTEPGAGSDAAALKTTAKRSGDHYVLNGTKQFISGAGAADFYFVFARTGDEGAGGVSAFAVMKDTPGLSFGAHGEEDGLERPADPAGDLRELQGAGRQPHRRGGPGLQVRHERARRRAHQHRRLLAGRGLVRARQGAPVHVRAQGVRPRTSPTSRRCSSRSPTWRPSSRPRA